MSEWGPPSSSQTPRQPTDGVDALLLKIEAIKRQIADLPNGLLRAAGIEITPDGMRIDSELTVTGNTRIEGTLDLPAGIIGNDALAHPIIASDVFNATDGFGYSTSDTERAADTLSVPEGFDVVTFTGSGSARCYNDTASTIYVFAQTHTEVVGGLHYYGPLGQAAIPAGYQATVTAPHSATLPVGDGSQVRMWVEVRAGAAPAAHGGNFATVEGVAWFSRG